MASMASGSSGVAVGDGVSVGRDVGDGVSVGAGVAVGGVVAVGCGVAEGCVVAGATGAEVRAGPPVTESVISAITAGVLVAAGAGAGALGEQPASASPSKMMSTSARKAWVRVFRVISFIYLSLLYAVVDSTEDPDPELARARRCVGSPARADRTELGDFAPSNCSGAQGRPPLPSSLQRMKRAVQHEYTGVLRGRGDPISAARRLLWTYASPGAKT